MTKSGTKNRMRQQKTGVKSFVYKILEVVYTEFRNRDWEKQVKKYLSTNRIGEFDVVFSSYPSISAHWLAQYIKQKGLAKKWFADFRDPMVLESSKGIDRKWLARRQAKLVESADIVTHVSRIGVEQFVCYTKDKEKVKWLPNGFDKDDFKFIDEKQDSKKEDISLILAYAGGLYGGERDCSPIFKAIGELISEGKINHNEILFRYAGRDGSILNEQASTYGMEMIVQDMGQLTRAQAIRMQAESDCVIVATFCYNDNGGAMTGKIYEPIMMRKPILMTVKGPGKNSEPAVFVKDLNAGSVYEESANGRDVTPIKKAILDMIVEKRTTGIVASKINEKKRSQYSYPCIISSFEHLICGDRK